MAQRAEPIPYYPDWPCYMARLRPRDPAPRDGCTCAICEHFRRWVPVVLTREPFHGELRRRG